MKRRQPIVLVLMISGGLGGCIAPRPGRILARHEGGGSIEVANREASLQRIRADCNGDFEIIAEREEIRLDEDETHPAIALLAFAAEAASGSFEEEPERFERIVVWDYACKRRRSMLTGRPRQPHMPVPNELAVVEVEGLLFQAELTRLPLDWNQAQRYCERLEPTGAWRVPDAQELSAVELQDSEVLWATDPAGPLHVSALETKPARPDARAAVRCVQIPPAPAEPDDAW